MKSLTIKSSTIVEKSAEKIKNLAEDLNKSWYLIKGAMDNIYGILVSIEYEISEIESNLEEENK